jgi:hypothetical protein
MYVGLLVICLWQSACRSVSCLSMIRCMHEMWVLQNQKKYSHLSFIKYLKLFTAVTFPDPRFCTTVTGKSRHSFTLCIYYGILNHRRLCGRTSRPGYDAVSLGEQFPTFRSFMVPSRSNSLQKVAGLLGWLDPEYTGSTMLRNVENRSRQRHSALCQKTWTLRSTAARTCAVLHSGCIPGYLKAISNNLHKSVSDYWP